MRALPVVLGCLAILLAASLPTQAQSITSIDELKLLTEAVASKDPKKLFLEQDDDRRDALLKRYTQLTGDTSAMDRIQDNRVFDATLASLPVIAFSSELAAPVGHCNDMRGNYVASASFGEDVAKAEAEFNHVACENVAAAARQALGRPGGCDEALVARVKAIGPIGEKWSVRAIQDCLTSASKLEEKAASVRAATMSKEVLDLANELSSPLQDCDASGEWRTDYGAMTLIHEAGTLHGNYTWDTGRLAGQLIEGSFNGTWSESPSYAGPTDAGRFEFNFTDDCSSFVGRWSYADGVWKGAWGGTRAQKAVTPDIPLPQLLTDPFGALGTPSEEPQLPPATTDDTASPTSAPEESNPATPPAAPPTKGVPSLGSMAVALALVGSAILRHRRRLQ